LPQGAGRGIVSACGPMRVAGEWWRAPFARDYFEVVLEGGGEESALVDHEQLCFSLAELLANACRESAPGSRVRVMWHRGTKGLEVIDVVDSGRGIPAAHAGEIGKPYFTTSPGRTGLGLATVAKICRLAGGSLSWDNLGDRGCRFTAELPIG